ncbi:hypothetical protein [Acinetobacter terrae]|uniref:hypothetical protein n=1 Tax=Acinetobacter terrae TaxID=2731247 RepID=UPI001D17484D|nr:hypothetical protein [Acinetobacter terrae]
MNQKSLNWGIGITVVWLAVIVAFWIFGGLKSPTSLNELGDFLAGIFAPVAFFWLILGYVQQGKQLEQNTKALEQQERALQLQIDEMKNSVEQQSKLAQMQSDQLIMMKQEIRPFLKLSHARLFLNSNKYATLEKQLENDEKYILKFLIKNEGRGRAKFINIFVSDVLLRKEFSKLDENETVTVEIQSNKVELEKLVNNKNNFLCLTIKFKDIYDAEFSAFYDFTTESIKTNKNIMPVNILSYQNQYNSDIAN